MQNPPALDSKWRAGTPKRGGTSNGSVEPGRRSGSASSRVPSATLPTSSRTSKPRCAVSSVWKRRRSPRRSYSVTAMPSSARCWRSPRPRSRKSPSKCVGCSARRSSKPRSPFCPSPKGSWASEILEAQEPFGEGQKGSSAMPHKRNPELAERICGLARLVRTNALAALENVALWHERDISHSSVERVILPDSTIMLDYLLSLTTFIVEGLDVDPARMRENLELSHGLVYSQRVLLKLTDAGLARQVAYEIVQRNAMRAWKERRSFFELLAADPTVMARLSPDELKSCFDPAFYVKNVDAIFKRLGLTQ